MSEKLEVNYEVLYEIAGCFGDHEAITKSMYNVLKQHIDDLRKNGWVGEGADAFYAEMDELLLPALKRLQASMVQAENVVKTIATEFENAEDEAKAQLHHHFVQAPPDVAINDNMGVGNNDPSMNDNMGVAPSPKPEPDSSPAPQQPPIGFPPSGRSGDQLNGILNSFNVESNQRYEKFRDGNPNTYDTYCNLFAHDVAKKLGAPLPLYVTDGNGNITKWLGATNMTEWLNGNLNVPGQYSQGPANGWRELSHSEAVNAANGGHLVVAAGHGHMAVVRSGGNPGAGLNQVPIAQAGERNFSSGVIQNGWGQYASSVQFFVYKA